MATAIIPGLKDECARRGLARALIDIRQVEGDIPGHERYDLGLKFADVMVSHDEALLMRWLMAADP